MAKIAIAGGGICGLSAALMLAEEGHDVVVIERDSAATPPDIDAAFDWDRTGVAQFGLGHWMHSRGTSILQAQLPRVYELLGQHGAYDFNFIKYLFSMQPDWAVEADDDRFDLRTARRSTIEWALATAASEHPLVAVRRGEAIAGLLVGEAKSVGVPHVSGLRLKSGEEVGAAVVVDATGRKSPTPQWLEAIGAATPTEDGADSGFAYYGRYYRSDDGSVPPMLGPALAPMDSFSVLTLPADNGTWALTLYAMSDDKPLRRFRDPQVFDRVINELPLHKHWLEGEPLTEMKSMAGGVDRHRSFVVDGAPCATGILSVADASSCTNPSLGRGMTLGLMHVEVMCQTIADHLLDPMAMALRFHERTEAELLPYHDATVALDRRRLAGMQAYRDGVELESTAEDQIGAAIEAAVREDPTIARVYGEILGCNALADDVLARPGVFERIIEIGQGATAAPVMGPDRAQLLELVS